MSIIVTPKSSPSATAKSDLASLDDNELQAEICGVASYAAAARCRLLLLVAELERRGAWNEWGVRSCAHWLNWQCGISLHTAREHVRVAVALPSLPLTVSFFERGELSYAKVRAITRAATPANEELLVSYAKMATASQLEQIVRGMRSSSDNERAN